MVAPDTLHAELARWTWLRDKLLEAHNDLDEDTLSDTLDGATSLTDLLSSAVRAQLDDQALASALKARVNDMAARQQRIEERVQATRELIVSAMEQAGLRKLNQPDFTLSLRPGTPPLVIIDEGAIPDDYWARQAPKLKRADLRAALNDGKDIPGAVLGNPQPTISVRVR